MIGPIYLNFFTDMLEIFKPCVTIFCWRPLVVVDVMKKYFCVYLGVSNDIGKEKRRGKKKCNWIKKIFSKVSTVQDKFFFQKSKQVVRGDIETLKNHWTVYLRAQCIYLQLLYYIILLWLGILFFVWIIMRVKTCLFGAFRLIKERPKYSNSYILLVPSRIWRNSLTFCLKGYNVNG